MKLPSKMICKVSVTEKSRKAFHEDVKNEREAHA
jgi:hypothetical protein